MSKKTRYYAVYVKHGRRWVRIVGHQYPKEQAIRKFQDLFLDLSCRGVHFELRPVKRVDKVYKFTREERTLQGPLMTVKGDGSDYRMEGLGLGEAVPEPFALDQEEVS